MRKKATTFEHPSYNSITEIELTTMKRKNSIYRGKKHGELGNFNRVSSILSLYPKLNLADREVYALVLAMKHIDSILISLSDGKLPIDFYERVMDVAIYFKLIALMDAEKTLRNRRK